MLVSLIYSRSQAISFVALKDFLELLCNLRRASERGNIAESCSAWVPLMQQQAATESCGAVTGSMALTE